MKEKRPGNPSPYHIRRVFPKGLKSGTAIICLLSALVFSPASMADEVLRVTLSKSRSGGIDGWKVKEWNGRADYAVVDTEIGRALSLKSSSDSSALYREVKFDIRHYPHLNWKWKVTRLPREADVRKKTADDQAGQIYVIFPRFPARINSRIIGYIWDTGAPEGTMVASTKSSNTRYVVVKSGSGGLGKWWGEKRNVYEDYKKLFMEEPPQVGSVSVMIDSDDTRSHAEAMIGDIFFSRD